MFGLVALLLAWSAPHGTLAEDVDQALEKYAPKGCKYNTVPMTLESRAYASYTGEIHVNDVFGMPSAVKRHVMQLTAASDAFITLQAEVHRDTPATLTVGVYKRAGRGSRGRVLFGKQLLGSGGEDAKVFLHGKVEAMELDIVFELSTVEVAKSQVDAHVSEARCWPVRLDITVIPVARAALHWPATCPRDSVLPEPLETKGKVGDTNGVVVLGDEGIVLSPVTQSASAQTMNHFVYHFDDRPVSGFGDSLWSGIVEVPPKLHRFVRLFFRASFRFASAPLQLVIELFDLKDEPDQTALAPACAMGCLGGVPVYNGQLIDHAMPTGFRYRIWVLRAGLSEWLTAVPDGNNCLEFDLDYSIKFEQGMTPFEVGPAAWLCAATRLPSKIVQTGNTAAWKEHVEGQLIVGRTIWVRDRFSFPPEEVADMEHRVSIELSEPSIFRATTHHSDGVDVFIVLTKKGFNMRQCKAIKHPGPVPRQTIFCYLPAGSYELTFFADYPLGGLHPCGDFFAQIGIRPASMTQTDQTKQCIDTQSDMTKLMVQSSFELATTPAWKTIKVPIQVSKRTGIVVVWRNAVTVSQENAAKKPYLRLVVHSDYISSDLRFQVRFAGKYVADTQVTAHGYADMIGPLDEGTYDVEMYYISGTGGPEGMRLCSTSMVDLRLVSRTAFSNSTALWMCSSIRVPPPDTLAPQPDEQVLIDSEYVIPEQGYHLLRLKVTERRLVRIVALSQIARFQIALRQFGEAKAIVRGIDNIQASLNPGTYVVKLTATFRSGKGASCSTFVLNMLLQPESTVPQCPWSPKVSDADMSQEDAAQKQASDHIGNLKLDLSPQAISKDFKKAPAVSMWMNQVMEKSFEMNLDSASAVRVEVAVQPPFLPIELVLRRQRAHGKLEAPISVGEWQETRLLLMNSDVPKGKYVLQFLQNEKYFLMDGRTEDDMSNICAHVTIFAEVGVASKEAVNTMRSELLDLPDLLAVQPFPPSINMIGWHGSSHQTVVGTQVYRFPDGIGKSSIKLDEKAIVRIICEPADLSNSAIEAKLLQNGNAVATSDNLGQLVAQADPGSYDLELKPAVQTSPFLVTFGIATESRMQQDVQLLDSGATCSTTFPKLMPPVGGFSPKGWNVGPVVVRLKPPFLSQEGQLARIPIRLASPSVLYIEVGSALPLDLVRIAIAVPEGLWVGEQRGLRNSLDIELPAGQYFIHIAQPKPAPATIRVNRCLDFSVRISATPLNPDSATEDAANSAAVAASGAVGSSMQAGPSKELDAREEEAVDAAPCFSMGTVPLPLDLSDPAGGSQSIGGPIDKDGRMLLRARVMITDMHDGRKKTYIGVGGKNIQMKVGISLGGYSTFSLADQVNFGVQNTMTRDMLQPVETWSTKDGWERIYILEGEGFWLIFHHPHRERTSTACVHFGLQIETHPVADASPMIQCTGDEVDPETQFPKVIDIADAQRSQGIFRLSRPHLSLRQPKEGFLTTSSFTLTTKSWVSVEVGYNFYISHAEMDIVKARAGRNKEPAVESQLDFIHGAGHKLDARLVAGDMLNPGEYTLRVADDHYSNQFGDTNSQLCFPFSVEFIVVPEKMVPPLVISVLPHPSVPIPQGADFVVTLRFSEPPLGTVDEVVQKISLGGVQAHVGGSYNEMTDNFAMRQGTTVQASVEEGHRVWIITFLADSLATLSGGKLEIAPTLVGNTTRKSYRFSAPTYTFGIRKQPPPWFGGSEKTVVGNDGTPKVAPKAEAASSGGGASRPAKPPSSDGGAVGAVRMEGGNSPSGRSSSSSSNSNGGSSSVEVGAVNFGSVFKREEPPPETSGVMPNIVDVMPNIEEWHPMEAAAPTRRRRSASSSADGCPSGMVLNSDGVCETGSAGWPIGYQSIMLGTSIAVAAFLYFYRGRSRTGYQDKRARFSDIGQRTSAEEISLVQAMDMDEDML